VTSYFFRSFTLAGVLMAAAVVPAAAQDAPISLARSLKAAQFPRWDASGSIGFLSLKGSETPSPWADYEVKAEYRFDLGRYWTSHLKTDVAVSATNGWQKWQSVPLSVPGVPNAYAYDDIDRRLFTIAPAVTWQFRENTFMHPYVSGGVKVGMLNEHRVRESGTLRFPSVGYTVALLDERRTVVTARPFVAGGFKSYISRSVFARTEARLAVADDGMRQLSVLAGVGVDF
jgi:hypothetical protein